IQASRFAQPSMKRFTVRRILGAADLWVTEFVLTYNEQPSYTVSIMEFKDGKVARETQYFGDAFEPGPSRDTRRQAARRPATGRDRPGRALPGARAGTPWRPRSEEDVRNRPAAPRAPWLHRRRGP